MKLLKLHFCTKFDRLSGFFMPIGRKCNIMKIGRNAGSGQFTPVKTAQNKPATHVVETIKRTPTPAPTPRKTGK